MKTRALTLTLGITAVLSASALTSPIANAAQLNVAGDTCTLTFSDIDVQALEELYHGMGEGVFADLKKALPSVRGDIDLVIDNDGDVSEAVYARIDAAAVAAGFNAGESRSILDAGIQFSHYESSTEVLEADTFSKTEAAERLASGTSGVGGDYPGSAPAGAIMVKAVDRLRITLGDWQRIVDQACVDGRSGTYNLKVKGSGSSGSTDLSSPSGSSVVSFGSS